MSPDIVTPLNVPGMGNPGDTSGDMICPLPVYIKRHLKKTKKKTKRINIKKKKNV